MILVVALLQQFLTSSTWICNSNMEAENVTGTSKWESVLEAFANATKSGWIAFKLQVLMRGTLMRESILPGTVITRDRVSSSEDAVSKCLFPTDAEIKQSIAPVAVFGDGNCRFRSVSNSVFGTENDHIECRVRCVYELVSNFIKYTSSETYAEMSTKPSAFQYIFETSISDDARVTNDVSKFLKNEIMKSVNNGQYSSLLHLYATANAFNRPIVTIFPQVQNIVIDRQVHNQEIRPLDFSEDQSGPSMYIMWTHTSNTNKQMWRPNHFVSCHLINDAKQSPQKASSEHPSSPEKTPSGQPPLKKQKVISDYFKYESYDDNKPASTDSQSHEHTDDKAKQPENSDPGTADRSGDKDDQTDTDFHRSSKYDLGDIVNGNIPLSSLSETEKISLVENSSDPEILQNLPFQTKQVSW